MNKTGLNYAQLADNLIKEIETKGFDSLKQSDFQIFLFNEFRKTIYKNKTIHEISLDLRIKESKVKELCQMATLRYSDNVDAEAKADLLKIWESIKITNIGDSIKFCIENETTRNYINSLLKADGRFSDSSFNPEIVSLSDKDYKFLVKNIEGFDLDKYIKDSGIVKLLKNKIKEIKLKDIISLAKEYCEEVLPESGTISITIKTIIFIIDKLAQVQE